MKALTWILIAAVIIIGGFYAVTHLSGTNQNQISNISSAGTKNSQTPGCDSQYVSAAEIATTLGLSSQTTLSSGSSYGICNIWWKDSSSNFTGEITVTPGLPSAAETVSIDCTKGSPLNIGDKSCSLDNPAAKGGSEIIIAKGSTMVVIFPTSTKSITTDQLSSLGSLITSRI